MTAIAQRSLSTSILIVDEDTDARQEMAEALLDQGFIVHHAENSEEALSQARKHRPMYILMDYFLPGTTGVEIAAEIRKYRPTVQVIMISGFGIFHKVATTSNTAALAVLKKPINIDSFIRVINRHLAYLDAVKADQLTIEQVKNGIDK